MWGNNCEVEVGGVGYCIWVGRNFVKKHNQGEEVTVSTYMAVSENEINLFGFENWEEVDADFGVGSGTKNGGRNFGGGGK